MQPRRSDPVFGAVQQTLTAKGKPHKVIRIALADKLLVRPNANACDRRPVLAAAA